MRYFDRAFALADKILKTDPENPYAGICEEIKNKLEKRGFGTKERIALLRKELTIPYVWEVQVKCILTNQQKSAIDNNKSETANNFDYDQCVKETANLSENEKIEYFDKKMLTLRFHPTRAKALSKNLEFFKNNGDELLKKLKELRKEATSAPVPNKEKMLRLEREVADYLEKHLDQVSYKTSRNILQMLGLSHYVIPIDSRVAEEASDLGIAVGNLQNKKVYVDVENRLIQLAESVKISSSQLDGYLFFHRELESAINKLKEMLHK